LFPSPVLFNDARREGAYNLMSGKMGPDSGAQMLIGVSGLGVSAESRNDYGHGGDGVETGNYHGAWFVIWYGSNRGRAFGALSSPGTATVQE